MDCGAFKNGFCAIKNSSEVVCSGDRFKCDCPEKLEAEIRLITEEWFKRKGGNHAHIACS